MLTSHARERRKGSKIQAFRCPKSSPEASGRPKIEPGRPGSRDKTRKSRAKLIVFFESGRERADKATKSDVFGGQERAGSEGTDEMVRQEH